MCLFANSKRKPELTREQQFPSLSHNPATMENSAQRRLESIARHLLLAQITIRDLHLNPLGGVEPSPVIIGGMVLDIHAKPYEHPSPGTTTPGKVQYVSGGVARNVAECMSKLGTKPFLISVIGHDMAGDLLLRYWKSAGLSMEGILQLPGATTPVVSNVFDCSGELAAAVASVEAVERFLTPEWIHRFQHNICTAPVLMVDANLPPQSLEFSCQRDHFVMTRTKRLTFSFDLSIFEGPNIIFLILIAAGSGIPIWFEPVSVTKSTRIASVIDYITCASPNGNELVAMANALLPLTEFEFVHNEPMEGASQSVEYLFQMLKPPICFLLQKGIKLLLVTLGSNGVFLCCKEGLSSMKDHLKSRTSGLNRHLHELVREACPSEQIISSVETGHRSFRSCIFHFPALPASVVSLTGAGDCLVGGILASLSAGLNVTQSVAVGIAVAKAAVETETNIPTKICSTSVADDAKRILSAARPLLLE